MNKLLQPHYVAQLLKVSYKPIKQLIIFMLLTSVIAIAVDWWRGQVLFNKPLPVLNGVTLSGDNIDIIEMSKDGAVLVYFWARWCPVCDFVSPAVNFTANYFPVVTVAMSSGDDVKMNQFLQYKDYRFNTINDNHNQIAQDWAMQFTPTLMVFNDGQLKHYTTGFTSLIGIWWRMLLN